MTTTKLAKDFCKRLEIGTVLRNGLPTDFLSDPLQETSYDPHPPTRAIVQVGSEVGDLHINQRVQLGPEHPWRWELLGVSPDNRLYLRFTDAFSGKIAWNAEEFTLLDVVGRGLTTRMQVRGVDLYELPLIKMDEPGEANGTLAVDDLTIKFQFKDLEFPEPPPWRPRGLRPWPTGGRIRHN